MDPDTATADDDGAAVHIWRSPEFSHEEYENHDVAGASDTADALDLRREVYADDGNFKHNHLDRLLQVSRRRRSLSEMIRLREERVISC